MERIKQSLTRDYLAVRLDLNDLREIGRILEGTKTFEITIGNSKCNSIDDLAEHFKSQKLLETKIHTTGPYITIDLDTMRTNLLVGSDDAYEAGLFHKLDTVLMRARRQPAFLYSFPTVYTLNAVLLLVAPFIVPAPIRIVLFVLWSLWFLWVVYTRTFHASEILVFERHEKPGFLMQTRDQLLVNALNTLVSLTLGAIGGVLGGPYLRELIQKLWP